MDPVKYARALKLSFSQLLSPEEVKPFLDAHYAGDQEALRALKDKFQDEGDPRGDIWDRAEGLTGTPSETKYLNSYSPILNGTRWVKNDLGAVIPKRITNTSGDVSHTAEDGRHDTIIWQLMGLGSDKETKNPQGVRFTWVKREPYEEGMAYQQKEIRKNGYFTPTEARALADKFPSPHSEQIHQFLDQHFPETKRPETL